MGIRNIGWKGLPDRYLGATGYDSQQANEPEGPNRPDNLFEPVPGDAGAHGGFDDRAEDGSLCLWASKHRSWLALGILALGGAIAGGAISKR